MNKKNVNDIGYCVNKRGEIYTVFGGVLMALLIHKKKIVYRKS